MKAIGKKPARSGQHAKRGSAVRRDLSRFKRVLRQHLPELQARYRVKSLGVFGSYVRGEAKRRSDLDVLVELGDQPLSLIKFIELENYLSDLLGVHVDLVEREGLKPAIGQRILAERTSYDRTAFIGQSSDCQPGSSRLWIGKSAS